MRHFKILLIVFVSILTTVIVSSCNKDEIQKSQLNDTVQIRNSINLSDFPTKSGDLFVFSDTSQFISFYAQAADLAMTDISLLRDEFRSQNFISVAHLLEIDEFEDPNERYQPFLTDPVMREICNQYFEFQIGDILVTYINNTQILISDINNSSVRNDIRNLPKGNQIAVKEIPAGAYWGEDTDIESFIFNLCSCKLFVEKFDCNTIRVHGKCTDLAFGNGEASISVTLGFVSSPFPQTPTFTDRLAGNFEYFFDINNPMTIRVVIDPDCIFGDTKTIDFPFSPIATSCDSRERDSGWKWIDQNGEGLSYLVKYYKNFWSAYELADAVSMQWNPIKKKWEERNANRLITSIEASRRSPVNCVVFASENETKTCNNCKRRNASVNTGVFGNFTQGNHCDGDVIGTFTKINGLTTLNATLSLDFDCCL